MAEGKATALQMSVASEKDEGANTTIGCTSDNQAALEAQTTAPAPVSAVWRILSKVGWFIWLLLNILFVLSSAWQIHRYRVQSQDPEGESRNPLYKVTTWRFVQALFAYTYWTWALVERQLAYVYWSFFFKGYICSIILTGWWWGLELALDIGPIGVLPTLLLCWAFHVGRRLIYGRSILDTRAQAADRHHQVVTEMTSEKNELF